MKLAYIINARIPTEKAHGYQVCKMCEEFAKVGISVNLYIPTRSNFIDKDLFDYYGIQRIFNVRKIKFFDFIKHEKFFFKKGQILQTLFFVAKLLFLPLEKGTIVYTRNAEIAWLFKLRGYKAYCEAHFWPASKNSLYRYFLRKVDGIFCNSNGTMEKHKQNRLNNLLVTPNGVDLKDFALENNKASLRKKLSLPADKKIIMYVGHLYGWKGVDTVVKAASLTSDHEQLFVFIGGTDTDLAKYQQILKDNSLQNILLLGRKEKTLIPSYLQSADILLLPNVPISTESIEYTSPIKMFEYMASGVPIIASNLPSIAEILDDKCAFLSTPGDAEDLVKNIQTVFDDPSVANQKAINAKAKVQNYTWQKRAERILEFMTV